MVNYVSNRIYRFSYENEDLLKNKGFTINFINMFPFNYFTSHQMS